jgi:hypothetical protein
MTGLELLIGQAAGALVFVVTQGEQRRGVEHKQTAY